MKTKKIKKMTIELIGDSYEVDIKYAKGSSSVNFYDPYSALLHLISEVTGNELWSVFAKLQDEDQAFISKLALKSAQEQAKETTKYLIDNFYEKN